MRVMKIALMIVPFTVAALSFSFDSKAQVKQPSPTPTPAVSPTASPKTKDEEVIKITTDLVTLTATVVDKNGRYRADLKQSDFTVYEDGTKQEIAILTPATEFQ